MEVILPVIDTELLQKKANEFAQKGAEDALKDFYTGYNSPYKKAIEEHLISKGIDNAIAIPDIIGILNESIAQEVDLIANNAVSKSFVPLVKEFLTRADGEVKLSDILKKFIETTGYEYDADLERDSYSIETVKDDGSFMYVEISNGAKSYEVHFYLKDKDKKLYEIYMLPHVKRNGQKEYYPVQRTMKLSIDSVTLEMPFTPNVLSDQFTSYIAKMVIASSKITMDVDDFDEDFFPERHCSCH